MSFHHLGDDLRPEARESLQHQRRKAALTTAEESVCSQRTVTVCGLGSFDRLLLIIVTKLRGLECAKSPSIHGSDALRRDRGEPEKSPMLRQMLTAHYGKDRSEATRPSCAMCRRASICGEQTHT
ncbi:hypothetical protein FI667_g7242, partial [Globisporangium splendens]